MNGFQKLKMFDNVLSVKVPLGTSIGKRKMADRELLTKLGIVCPICNSLKVITRKKDNMRRCERCGTEWPKIEAKVEEGDGGQ